MKILAINGSPRKTTIPRHCSIKRLLAPHLKAPKQSKSTSMILPIKVV